MLRKARGKTCHQPLIAITVETVFTLRRTGLPAGGDLCHHVPPSLLLSAMPALPQRSLLAIIAVTALLAGGTGLSVGLRLGKTPTHDLAADSLATMQPLLQLPPANDPGFGPALQQLQHKHSQHLLMTYRHANTAQRRQIALALGRANAQGWYTPEDFSRLQASLTCLEQRPEQPLPQCLAQQLQPADEASPVATAQP